MMVRLDDWLVGRYITAGTTNQRACYDNDTGTSAITDFNDYTCSATDCTKLNKILCYINYALVRVYGAGLSFTYSTTLLGTIIFSWHVYDVAGTAPFLEELEWEVPIRDYISQNWAPRKAFISLGESAGGLAPQFDFDNYNRNQGFQITFPEPGLYVQRGLTVKQNIDNSEPSGTQAPSHVNVIYQQASTSVDAKTGAVLNA